MYLFSYGSNTNQDHLDLFNKSTYITNGTLKDYKLYFNHLFVYANIMKKMGSYVKGTIHSMSKINKSLNDKEIMCKLIDVSVLGDDKKYYNCKTYISKFPLINLFVFPYYKKLLEKGYKHHNLIMPSIKSGFNLLFNLVGLLFGLYLILSTKFKIIGWLLIIIDFGMIFVHMFELNLSINLGLFKIIPFVVLMPSLILNYIRKS